MAGGRALIIDDDDDVRGLVRWLLENAGFTVAEAVTGRAGLRELFRAPPDVVILDVGLPELDGFEILERIREITSVPVLMLTAHGTESEKVRGLRGGADDYLTKPFGQEELLARVELLQARAASAPRSDRGDRYLDDYLSVDVAAREVRALDVAVPLTPREFQLLTTLVRHANNVLSRDQLADAAWDGARHINPEQVKAYIRSLRDKLEQASGAAPPIETVRGFGYRYRRAGRAGPRSG